MGDTAQQEVGDGLVMTEPLHDCVVFTAVESCKLTLLENEKKKNIKLTKKLEKQRNEKRIKKKQVKRRQMIKIGNKKKTSKPMNFRDIWENEKIL